MRLTILSRMVISLLAIFILSMVVNLYSIFQFYRLENITQSIHGVDDEIVKLVQAIERDYLPSMVRYEMKYFITRDEEIRKQFYDALGGVTGNLRTIQSKEDSKEIMDLVSGIEQPCRRYQRSFDDAVERLRSGADDADRDFGEVREDIKKGIEKLKEYVQGRAYAKLGQLTEIEGTSISVAIVISIASLIVIVAISIMITINITRPLAAIKRKTREIARGEYGGRLELSSPPEIQELEQAFNVMSSRLKEVDTMKTDFFSLMSHELRTPLTSIKEGINLLMDGLPEREITAQRRELLAIMMEETNRLIKLVNSLLDLSRMEAGMMVYAFSRTGIVELIKQVAREVEPLAATKHLTITIDADEDLPQVRVDGEKILQVLRNLIGNAVKFTPRNGQVRLSARATDGEVRVSVSDTGIGIARESLTTIFDKFQRDVLTHSHKIKGTGLGLSIAKHIVQAHGGRIWAESRVEQGSTFVIALPL